MWQNVSHERLMRLRDRLEFPNPEAIKQDKLIKSGIIRYPVELSPVVRLWRNVKDQRPGEPFTFDVPMGVAWGEQLRGSQTDDRRDRVNACPWLMQHQKEAVNEALDYKSGVIVAPCGAGKTQIGVAIHEFSHCELPTLVIVHTRDLVVQWAARFERLTGRKALVPKNSAQIAELLDFDAREADRPMMVATVQSLIRDDELADYWFGTVILDEAHHAPASTFKDVLSQLRCDSVYGLTATPNRADGWTPAMYAWLGPKRYEIEAAELQQVGLTLAPKILIVETKAWANTSDFTAACTVLAEDERRNQLIVDLVSEHGSAGRGDPGPQLVLTSRIEHAETLQRMIPDSVVVTGKTKNREQAFESIRTGEKRVLIATQLADEGLDLPALVAVHLTMPSRAEGRVIQRVGRVMRAAPCKSRPIVYDYVDDMGLFESQARSRIRAYRSELGTPTISKLRLADVGAPLQMQFAR